MLRPTFLTKKEMKTKNCPAAKSSHNIDLLHERREIARSKPNKDINHKIGERISKMKY